MTGGGGVSYYAHSTIWKMIILYDIFACTVKRYVVQEAYWHFCLIQDNNLPVPSSSELWLVSKSFILHASEAFRPTLSRNIYIVSIWFGLVLIHLHSDLKFQKMYLKWFEWTNEINPFYYCIATYFHLFLNAVMLTVGGMGTR